MENHHVYIIGKSTMFMAIFNSFLYVYQAGYIWHVRYPKLRLQRQLILRPSMGIQWNSKNSGRRVPTTAGFTICYVMICDGSVRLHRGFEKWLWHATVSSIPWMHGGFSINAAGQHPKNDVLLKSTLLLSFSDRKANGVSFQKKRLQ